MLAGGAGCASAAVPSVLPYGQVARFGGFADGSGTTYEALTTPMLESGKIVDPVGMAVDTNDTSDTTPGNDRYAIYVLENVNPQAMNSLHGEPEEAGALAAEYRIQKFDDAGALLASVSFTLQSSEAERGLHATAIAVDSQDGRVYVLIGDSLGELQPVADRIDVWTTGLQGDTAFQTGAAALPEDPLTHAGELVGPDAPGTVGVQSIDGVSLAVVGKSVGADIALGGTETGVGPVIERIFTEAGTSHKAGELDGSAWHEAAGTEDAAAKAWRQPSSYLNWLSANPDGSLDAVLGPAQEKRLKADEEPNMAWVGENLSGTRPILPWADAEQDASSEATNSGRAATVGFKSNQGRNNSEYHNVAETGATFRAGVLGPSVVGLSGESPDFSNGVYAGIVAHFSESAWLYDHTPSDLAIRVFDEHEHSLAMIANTTSGGPCNLEGGPGGENSGTYGYGSFAALAAGREGTIFALVQSDLTSRENSTKISPGSAVAASGEGDEVLEFAPGAGQNGKPGQECPQPLFPSPTETFSITNTTHPAEVLPATGEVTVEKGTTLEFNAGEANLQGAAAWEYNWGLESGVSESLPWHIESGVWLGAPAQTTHKYENTGTFPTTLEIVNDFGVLDAQRTVRVAEAKPCHAVFTMSGSTTGQPVSLNATGSTCEGQGDGIRVYSWNFGDSKTQSSPQPTIQHEYAEPGNYNVKLTVTDYFEHPYAETHSLSIASEEPHTTTTTSTTTTAPTTSTQTTTAATTSKSTTATTTAQTKTTSIHKLTVREKLARALALCKKKKTHRQRVACEKQAKKTYTTTKRKTTKSKHKK